MTKEQYEILGIEPDCKWALFYNGRRFSKYFNTRVQAQDLLNAAHKEGIFIGAEVQSEDIYPNLDLGLLFSIAKRDGLIVFLGVGNGPITATVWNGDPKVNVAIVEDRATPIEALATALFNFYNQRKS